MARYIDRSDRYHVRAAEIYDAEGLDACMDYLHQLVRSRVICASQAAHIIFWTVPDDVPAAVKGGAEHG